MSARRLLLVLGLLGIVGGLSYYAYRKGWFARDAADPIEIAKLNEKKLEPPPPATAEVGSYRWRGPTSDGRSPVGAFRTDWDKNPPKLLWKADCGGGFSSCVVVGGRLYTQDRQGGNERVLCLNIDDGKLIWEHTYPADYSGIAYGAGPRATPTVEGDRIFTVGARGELTCLLMPHEKDSKVQKLWSKNLLAEFDAPLPTWGVACSPLVVGDTVVVQPGGKKGAVVGYSKTGDVKWASGTNPPGYSSPVLASIGGQPTIFAFLGDALLALRTDGSITDSYPWRTAEKGNIATPLVVDDYVFISSAYSQGSALLRAEKRGDEVKLVQVYARRGRAYQNHHSSSVFKDRYLFGFSGMRNGARLKCVAFDTGLEKEEWDASGISGSGTLLLVDKHIIIQTEGGDLHLIEATPEEFRPVGKMTKVLSGNNNWATPTLVDGRLYLRDEQKIVCYDVRP